MVFLSAMKEHHASVSMGGHGGNVWAAARRLGAAPGDILDLSTNTFAAMAGHTAALIRAVLAAEPDGEAWLHYPDPEAFLLREALARDEGVPPAWVLPGGGASELVWAALAALRPRRALFLGPMFAQYARACEGLGIPWQALTPPESGGAGPAAGGFAPDSDALAGVEASDADLLVVCSPNNPGTAVLRDPGPLFRAARGRVVLFDASYRDFLWEEGGAEASAWEAHRYPRLAEAAAAHACRLVLLGSLTKFFCCPGARLGFAVAGPDLVERLAACRPAWTVTVAAERIGAALLEDSAAYRAALPGLRRDVRELAALLEGSGLFRAVLPGVSFVTAALRRPERARALQALLLERKRTLIRVCDNIPGMPPGFVRVQARPASALLPLREGLREFAAVARPRAQPA